MKIFFYLISILLILFPLKQAKRYRCGADELKLHPYNIEPTKEEEEEEKKEESLKQIIHQLKYLWIILLL